MQEITERVYTFSIARLFLVAKGPTQPKWAVPEGNASHERAIKTQMGHKNSLHVSFLVCLFV